MTWFWSLQWVKECWEALQAEIIQKSFHVCGPHARKDFWTIEFWTMENEFPWTKTGWMMKKSTASRKVDWLQTPGSQSEETLPCFPSLTNQTPPVCRAFVTNKWLLDSWGHETNACHTATWILAVASIRERWLFHSAHPEVQRQFESSD